jgi:predicted AAA+ superfamily ATPase
VVFVDEAQRIPHIGLALKMLIDARPGLEILATGSSSFNLAGEVGAPLTGRQTPLLLYPISVYELLMSSSEYDIKTHLEDYLIYGMYPEVRIAKSTEDKNFIINELANAYLLKDVLELEKIKKPKVLIQLLILIALQIGKEVSLHELSNALKLDAKTVARYLDILEKCFVLYNLRGFSRNLRSEVTKTSRYYFYDNGIRNSLIQNFNPLSMRNDIGELWENFIVTERMKTRAYTKRYAGDYFWRTWEKQEIDLIEEYGGSLHAYEFKWSPKKKPAAPKVFTEHYPGSSFECITPDNFIAFLKA